MPDQTRYQAVHPGVLTYTEPTAADRRIQYGDGRDASNRKRRCVIERERKEIAFMLENIDSDMSEAEWMEACEERFGKSWYGV